MESSLQSLRSNKTLSTTTDGVGEEEDLYLMSLVKEGDLEAFEKLVERHRHPVLNVVTKMLGSSQDAEDLTQQVFIRIWRSAPRYQATAKFTTWLFTITRNLVYNEYRRKKNRQTQSLEQITEENPNFAIPSDHEDAVDQLHQKELSKAIDEAIEKLPKNQKNALILRRYQELPYEEIGQILGMTLPAVKSLLFRARETLKHSLSSWLQS